MWLIGTSIRYEINSSLLTFNTVSIVSKQVFVVLFKKIFHVIDFLCIPVSIQNV